MKIEKIAAFSDGLKGGNPAGVAIVDVLPDPDTMKRVAVEVGFSETVFAAPQDGGWRVRYFAPEAEVPFCGHATIALGAALALRHGDRVFSLTLNDAAITVEGFRTGPNLAAALQSPPTRSKPAAENLIADALSLFNLSGEFPDSRLAPAIIEAGARHLLLALDSRSRLAGMRYDQSVGAALMREAGLATIMLIYTESPSVFHVRNAFASGGVYEDPATGAAAVALAGYLREIGWPHSNSIKIFQGDDMGIPSRLNVDIPAPAGSSVRVFGTTRIMAEQETEAAS